MHDLLNHLWQSTAFAVIVTAATAMLRRNSPRLRYWLWFAASVKFLIPFSLLVATGSRIQLPPDTPTLRATTVQQISTYFAPAVLPAPAGMIFEWTKLLTVIWIAGALFLLIRWFRRWRAIHAVFRRARRSDLDFPAPAYVSSAALEPGVFGIIRPVLLLPENLREELTHEQFGAILAHESRHIQFRDNLTAALHMIVETLFWFHPLVWWIGARLSEERERDCDEAVLREGRRPGDYARSIVTVCQTYAESPLPCASGISGADLKKRIREIMTWHGSLPASRNARALIAAAAFAAVSLPLILGVIRAQTLPAAPQHGYETVSIHRSDPGAVGGHIGPGPQGGLRTENTTIMLLLTFAYNVRDYQISSAPGWLTSERYDITFTPDKSEITPSPGMPLKDMQGFMERNRERMQAVLRDRLGLVMRAEMHQLPVYALTQGKGSNKLITHDEKQPGPSLRMGNGQLTGVGATVQMITMPLSQMLGRPVIDETGLTGQYDFNLTWTPDPGLGGDGPGNQSDPGTGASLTTALAEQLGLKLESKKGPVTVYVIEKIERPHEN